MKLIRNSMFALAGLGACLGVTATSASAQQASFTLPVEAHWGRAVLEPGDYRVKFPVAADPVRVIRVTGKGTTMYFIPQVTDFNTSEEGEGKLVLIETNGFYKVASISDPSREEAFAFPLPKSHETAAHSPVNSSTQAQIAVQLRKIAK